MRTNRGAEVMNMSTKGMSTMVISIVSCDTNTDALRFDWATALNRG